MHSARALHSKKHTFPARSCSRQSRTVGTPPANTILRPINVALTMQRQCQPDGTMCTHLLFLPLSLFLLIIRSIFKSIHHYNSHRWGERGLEKRAANKNLNTIAFVYGLARRVKISFGAACFMRNLFAFAFDGHFSRCLLLYFCTPSIIFYRCYPWCSGCSCSVLVCHVAATAAFTFHRGTLIYNLIFNGCAVWSICVLWFFFLFFFCWLLVDRNCITKGQCG